MMKEKRDRIRREKTRLQKVRVIWKREHPVEAAEKMIEDAMGRERKAVLRRDFALARKLKAEIKHDQWLLRKAEKNRRGPLVAAPKKQERRGIFNSIATALKAAAQRVINFRRRPIVPTRAY